jgi:hypothetical protein
MEYKTRNTIALALGLALAAGIAGCRVNVDKGVNGENKKVQVDTPFGGVHVNTDQTTAADLGLPVYPGATMEKGNGDHESADVHLGFGEWELRVRTVSYQSADSEEKVLAFYKKAMGRYGDVITCKDKLPVGTPATTSEGLSCTDDKSNSNVKIDTGNYNFNKGDLELKAGSKRHQHIVGFETPNGSQTRFAMVALDLPAAAGSGSGKSD